LGDQECRPERAYGATDLSEIADSFHHLEMHAARFGQHRPGAFAQAISRSDRGWIGIDRETCEIGTIKAILPLLIHRHLSSVL
jgi:hypothetical protein